MPRNIELVTRNFTSKAPLPSVELAYNSYKLAGRKAEEYVLVKDFLKELETLNARLEELENKELERRNI